MATIVIFSIAAMIVAAALALLVRNQCVYRFRGNLLRRISIAAQRDIACGDCEWSRRYDAFDAVSYNKMVWQFWKRLTAFYPDTSFAERRIPQEAAD